MSDIAKRTTPFITHVNPNEIFVFGSNESGRHGKGAAKLARQWGAKNGIGEGLSGNTYGIPTKDKNIRTLSKKRIQEYVQTFIRFAEEKRELVFLVTEVGCGLAGYKAQDIAPMFRECESIENIHLPQSFWNIVIENKS
jgi:hypothetical protein